jgi:hypothetical protein
VLYLSLSIVWPVYIFKFNDPFIFYSFKKTNQLVKRKKKERRRSSYRFRASFFLFDPNEKERKKGFFHSLGIHQTLSLRMAFGPAGVERNEAILSSRSRPVVFFSLSLSLPFRGAAQTPYAHLPPPPPPPTLFFWFGVLLALISPSIRHFPLVRHHE